MELYCKNGLIRPKQKGIYATSCMHRQRVVFVYNVIIDKMILRGNRIDIENSKHETLLGGISKIITIILYALKHEQVGSKTFFSK